MLSATASTSTTRREVFLSASMAQDERLSMFAAVFDLLGIRGTHAKEASVLDLHVFIQKGFPFASFERVAKTAKLPLAGAARVLGLHERTVLRRKEQSQRLTQAESEKVARLARVLVRAIDVLGDDDRASAWLNRSNRALGQEPISLLDTDVGAEAVLDVLGRIEHGIIG